MKNNISCDYSHVEAFSDPSSVRQDIVQSAQTLMDGSGAGAAFRGWLTLPEHYDREEDARIRAVAQNIREDADVFVVIGIGGSYLGARGAIEALKGTFYNELSSQKRQGPQIFFAGNNLSGTYLRDILTLLENKSVYVNVISKSGTTLEPAVAFRLITKELAVRYSADELRKRIIVTTDATSGALKDLADKKGYETFVVPDDIGGRYSVLTAVGRLPLAVAGIDIEAMMRGARDAMELYDNPYEENPCYHYVAARTALYRAGYKIEIFTQFEPAWHYFAEWWKQLFGESEGKEHKGLYPSSLDFTTDLHSLGQYVQEGERHLFKTILANASLPIVIFNNSLSGFSILTVDLTASLRSLSAMT